MPHLYPRSQIDREAHVNLLADDKAMKAAAGCRLQPLGLLKDNDNFAASPARCLVREGFFKLAQLHLPIQ